MFDALFGAILQGFGWALSGLYSFIPVYGIAIILLTILVRVILLPLTLKQIRSMHEMQKIQPHVKELQRKYKGNRQKLNEELQKLYKEHQVNPLGGCLPLLMQIPVFIALYAVLQATVGAFGLPDVAVPMSEVGGETTVCRPNTSPSVDGSSPTEVICEDGSGNTETYEITEWKAKKSREDISSAPSEVAFCRPEASEDDDEELGGFLCESRPGPGHLPADSELYATIVERGSSFLGMQLSCSPTQAGSEVEIRRCAPGESGGTAAAIPYYIMVALMAGTTYYQQRQMQRSATGQQAQQMKMMGILMPVFLAFISLQIAAGVLVYWITTNTWQIAQQAVILRRRGDAETPTVKAQVTKTTQPKPKGNGQASKGSGQTSKGSGNARNRKKRRKR